jgi:hypothetical protein
MKTNSPCEVLDQALRKRVPEDTNLLPQIEARFAKGKNVMKSKQKRLLGTALALIVLVAALFTWPMAVNALQRLFGYIPGVGMVEPGTTLRTLAEPVVVEREGVTITVEKGTADMQKTILRVTVVGVDATGGPYCDNPSILLRLADGTAMEENGGYGNIGDLSHSGEYTDLITFPALPPGSDDATLEIPCLWRVTEPENWKIPLHFVPTDGTVVNPVIELPSTTPTAPAAFETDQPTEAPYMISLTLDKVVPLDDGYLLIGSMRWTDKTVNIGPYFDNSYNLHAVDANGQVVTLEDPEQGAWDLLSPVEAGSLISQWIYKVPGKQHAWPLTLTTNAYVDLSANVSFTFDPGSNPHEGQVWQLGQELTVNGHVIRLVSATWQERGGSIASLEFETASDDPSVITLDIKDIVYRSVQRLCGGGGGKPAVVYCEALAPEPRNLTITSIRLLVPGPWHVIWQP